MAKKATQKAKEKRIPLRHELNEADTWDLSPLFKSDAAWERAFKKLEGKVPEFKQFRGTLGKAAKNLRAYYEFEILFDKEAERIGSYAFLKSSEDVGNSTYQGMVARYRHMAMHASEAASYVAPEIRSIPQATIDAYLKSPVLKDYRLLLERLLRYKPHILTLKEERLLAMQGEVAGAPSRAFDQLNDADMKFGFIRNEKGENIELTQGSFRELLESPKRAVRKKAFHQFYAQYEGHAHTLSAMFSGSILQDIYIARARNHPSALEASLFSDKVPVAVYDNLIEAVHNNLDTVHRYLDVRRRALKLRDLHFYDNYVPLAGDVQKHIPFEKAVETVTDALAPLGDGYCKTLREGLLHQRWADRYENQGKRSGAFSAGGYTGPPYMLLNHKTNILDSMFTLAHEAGHSMHTHYSARHQPYQYYDYKIFVAEVASTFNEQLLNHHLLKRVRDRKMKIFLINREIDEIRGTLVRQTMFAEYEKITHALAEAGEPLTLDRIRDEYRALLDRYFGPAITIDDELSLEGLRIPHFYRAFYVYKYATGISAAIALSQQVLNGGNKDRERYLNFLKGGSSKYPLDLLRDAGVDMETPEPVDTAMARFKELVDQLEALVG
jgi:oligoendopeptidase F